MLSSFYTGKVEAASADGQCIFGQASCGRLYVFHPQAKTFLLTASSPEEESTSLEEASRGWWVLTASIYCEYLSCNCHFYWRVVTDCQHLLPQICPSKSCFSLYSSAIQLSFSQVTQLIVNKSCQCWRKSIIWSVKLFSLSLLNGTIQFIFCQLIDYTSAKGVLVSLSPCNIF